MKHTSLISLLSLCALLSACRGRSGAPAAQQPLRPFPRVEIPAVYTDQQDRQAYLLDHFWDAFFAGSGRCDEEAILGVAHDEVEKQVATYIQLLEMIPLPQAQQQMRRFFSQVEKRHAADTASHVFLLMEQIVVRYLYDPNSPVRDEDLYLPYVEGLAASPYTREAVRPGYAYEAAMCALAPTGSVAPDFRFTDARGRNHHLHEVRAGATLLFFSNPGCPACLEIINTLKAVPGIDEMIRRGGFAVVNVYIDEDLDAWRDYEPSYPRNWLCGYDPDGLVRSDRIYNIRAIPSLYLLDRDKRILLKDAPTERVVSWIEENIKP